MGPAFFSQPCFYTCEGTTLYTTDKEKELNGAAVAGEQTVKPVLSGCLFAGYMPMVPMIQVIQM